MSVIISRALPDVRDGLKPSQRRILVAMHDLDLGPDRLDEQVRRHRRRDDEALPPARRGDHLPDAGAHGPGRGTCAIAWSTRRATSAPSPGCRRRRCGIAYRRHVHPHPGWHTSHRRDRPGRTELGGGPFLGGVQQGWAAGRRVEAVPQRRSPHAASCEPREGFEITGTGNHPLLCLEQQGMACRRSRWRLLERD